MIKNLPANAEDMRDLSLIPGLGRSPIEGNGNPLQYSCLENLMDRKVWQATAHSVAKSQTQLKHLSTHWCHSVKNLPATAALIPDPGRSHMPWSN